MTTSIGVLIALIVVMFYILYFGRCFRWWLLGRARSGVGLFRLMKARVYGADPQILVEARLLARAAGVSAPLDTIETQHLAGADVMRALAATIAASRTGVSLDFGEACLHTRTNRNPLDVIQERLRNQHRDLWEAAEQADPKHIVEHIGERVSVACRVAPVGIILVDEQPLFAVSTNGILEPGAHAQIVDIRGTVAFVQSLAAPGKDRKRANPLG